MTTEATTRTTTKTLLDKYIQMVVKFYFIVFMEL